MPNLRHTTPPFPPNLRPDDNDNDEDTSQFPVAALREREAREAWEREFDAAFYPLFEEVFGEVLGRCLDGRGRVLVVKEEEEEGDGDGDRPPAEGGG